MSNFLFNRFGGVNQQQPISGNIISQLAKVKNNPGYILDILLHNGKIDQKQYEDLQPYKNNPRAIAQYLINNGKQNEIHQAEQMANKLNT